MREDSYYTINRWEKIGEICEYYSCDADQASRYLDYLEEGYSSYSAKILSGLCDPDF